VLAVARDRIGEFAAATLGPRHTGVKAIVALIVIVFLLMALVPIPGRITADAETRALVSRTIPPPFEGFLESVRVKPGDRVQAGDVLAIMDMKDTQLQLDQARSQLQKLTTQQANARNAGGSGQGDAAMYAADIEGVNAEIRLHLDRIARGQITAPLSGEVSRGDIEPLAGAKVEPSTPLFEIIESGKLVIVLQVGEADIGFVEEGQAGRLAMTALPDTKIPIRVARIRPLGEPVKGANVFVVEAEVDTTRVKDEVGARYQQLDAWLKPGMTGTARLEHGTTTVLWELCQPVIDAARMRLWW
jgi:multidrug resistance efflux pump